MQQKPPDELPGSNSDDLQGLSPRAAATFKALKEAMLPFGVIATNKAPNPDPSTTTKTRFVFLAKDNSPPDADAQPND